MVLRDHSPINTIDCEICNISHPLTIQVYVPSLDHVQFHSQCAQMPARRHATIPVSVEEIPVRDKSQTD